MTFGVEVIPGVHAMGMFPEFYEKAVAFGAGQQVESRRIMYEECPELFDVMRAAVPIEGTDIVEIYSVAVPPGRSIKAHEHVEWVALYYPEPADTPLLVGDDHGLLMRAGELVVIAPHVLHSVPRNESGRLRQSIAMKVEAKCPTTSQSADSHPPKND